MKIYNKETKLYNNVIKLYNSEINYLKSKVKKLKNNPVLRNEIKRTNELYTKKAKTVLPKEHYEASSAWMEASMNVNKIKNNLGIKSYSQLITDLETQKEFLLKEIENHLGSVLFHLCELDGNSSTHYSFFSMNGVYIWITNIATTYILYDNFDYYSTELFEELIKYLPKKNSELKFILHGKNKHIIVKDDIFILFDEVNFNHFSTVSLKELFEEIIRINNEYT